MTAIGEMPLPILDWLRPRPETGDKALGRLLPWRKNLEKSKCGGHQIANIHFSKGMSGPLEKKGLALRPKIAMRLV